MHARVGTSALLALTLAGAGGCGGHAPEVVTVHLRADLVALGGRDVELVEGAGRPRTEIVAPSPKLATEKESLPTWVVPPGSTVAFALDLEEPEGRLRLSGYVGADQSAWEQLAQHPAEHVELTLSIDGEPRARARLRAEDSPAWIALEECAESPAALIVEPDARLELTCGASGALGELDLSLGFARLVVEEHRTLRRRRASPAAPNVVFFVMDTLRADRTSAYGYDRPTTPALERLAARGTLFEQAYSTAPWTWPSTASLLTARTPAAHGVTDSRSSYLASELTTLPEAALEAGLLTGAFVGNPLIVPQRNFDQGFHRFRGTKSAELLDAYILVPEAIEWLERVADGRFFLYVQAMDPHEPHSWLGATEALFPARKPRDYPGTGMVGVRTMILRKRGVILENGRSRLAQEMPPGWIEYARATYERAVRTGDERFAELLNHLEANGLEDRTVVAFTSDHGEEFLDHGGLLHGNQLYEESVRVPLVLAGPGVPVGERIATPVSNLHLPVSLAQLAGIPFDPGLDVPGLFEIAEDPLNPVRFSNHNGTWDHAGDAAQSGLRRGDWKLVLGRRSGAPEGEGEAAALEELVRAFELDRDPAERTSRPDALPSELLDLLRSEEANDLRWRPATISGEGEDTRAMLIELGYLDED